MTRYKGAHVQIAPTEQEQGSEGSKKRKKLLAQLGTQETVIPATTLIQRQSKTQQYILHEIKDTVLRVQSNISVYLPTLLILIQLSAKSVSILSQSPTSLIARDSGKAPEIPDCNYWLVLVDWWLLESLQIHKQIGVSKHIRSNHPVSEPESRD